MPSQLPKVQGYVSQLVAVRLEEFRAARGLGSTSQAVSVALAEFFDLSEPPVNPGELAELRTRVQALEELPEKSAA